MTGPDGRARRGDRASEGDVEGFFAAHRESVPELSTDDATWHRIRAEHRRRGRAARRTFVAGMAVAASALAVASYAVWPHLDPDPGPTAQQGGAPAPGATEEAGREARETGEDEAGAASPLPEEPGEAGDPDVPDPTGPLDPGELPPPVAAGQVEPALPDDLVLTALGQDRQGGMSAVATSERSGTEGALLLRAPDATGPWEVVADLGALAAGADAGQGDGAEDGSGGVWTVEFVDAGTGYAWREQGLHLTTDGGATWQPLPLEGLLVHDVLVRAGTVHIAVTGTECQHGACGGLSLLTGPAGATELLLTPVVPESEPVPAPVLRAAGDEVYLHAPAGPPGPAAAGTGAGSWRWQGSRAEELAPPLECDGPAQALAGAPDQRGLVVTLCPGQDRDGFPLLAAASTLGGRTWGPASSAVTAPGEEEAAGALPVHLAAADPSRFAVIAGGQTRTSTDGGRTWQAAAEPLPLAAGQVAGVAALPDGTLVALAAPDVAEPGGYWASEDGGQRWRWVHLEP